jgi:hypothetical protein
LLVVEDEDKGGGLGGGGVVCGVLVHAKLPMFLHLVPVVGVKYFPPKVTYVFIFLLFRICACGHGLRNPQGILTNNNQPKTCQRNRGGKGEEVQPGGSAGEVHSTEGYMNKLNKI